MTPTWTKWLWFGLFLIIIAPLLIWGIRSINDNSKKENEKMELESSQKSANSSAKTLPRPDECHLLKNGDKPIRIYMNGFKCDYFGDGKKYYHQAQNGPVEIWGGDSNCPTGKGSPNATYADIWYYNEEITVVCKFRH